jgi:hypothetical protein
MIVEGNQCASSSGLYDNGTAKYKIRPTNIVMKRLRKHKTLDEESNPWEELSVVACTVYELEFFISRLYGNRKANFIMKRSFENSFDCSFKTTKTYLLLNVAL